MGFDQAGDTKLLVCFEEEGLLLCLKVGGGWLNRFLIHGAAGREDDKLFLRILGK
jgi:hypothetical protein